MCRASQKQFDRVNAILLERKAALLYTISSAGQPAAQQAAQNAANGQSPRAADTNEGSERITHKLKFTECSNAKQTPAHATSTRQAHAREAAHNRLDRRERQHNRWHRLFAQHIRCEQVNASH